MRIMKTKISAGKFILSVFFYKPLQYHCNKTLFLHGLIPLTALNIATSGSSRLRDMFFCRWHERKIKA